MRSKTFLLLLLIGNPASSAGLPCAQCHKDIAAKQAKTAMANTWLPVTTKIAPDDTSLQLPVSFMVGGRRHGVGFLSYISQVQGIPLAHKTLIQARYAWSPEKQKMLLAPGCSAATPQTLEEKLGLALSPTFEERCLSCHGQKDGGITCQNCHGHAHPQKRLSNEESMAVCAQCHVGLTRFADPSGEDLLVANQVEAIQRSECYLQSRKAFNCTTCHDPHQDATDDTKAEKVCLSCHVKSHASGGCIGCHMPSVEMGPLHLVDHLIRVHGPTASAGAYARMIATKTKAEAEQALNRVRAGESFYEVARAVSIDSTASIGGYVGRRPGVRAGAVMQDGARWVIYERLPRNFKWKAQELLNQGKAQEALKIYPYYLRALNAIGVAQGRPDVLRLAAKLYPQDAATQFALGAVLEAQGQIAEAEKTFEQTIALEKDFTTAYVRLGTIEYQAGDWHRAVDTFRQGLQIDPMSAELNAGLGRSLLKTGDATGAKQATALAENLR